jgi:hypothetical protein
VEFGGVVLLSDSVRQNGFGKGIWLALAGFGLRKKRPGFGFKLGDLINELGRPAGKMAGR